jgi:hypothetical protein
MNEQTTIQFLKNKVLSDTKEINRLLFEIGRLEDDVRALESRLSKTGTDVSLDAQIKAFELIDKKDLDGLWDLLTEHFSPSAWMNEEQIKEMEKE